MYRRQEVSSSQVIYESLLPGTIAAKRVDGNLRLLNYHWLMLTILVMFAGFRSGRWQWSWNPATDPSIHPMHITVIRTTFKVFIIGDEISGLSRLIDAGQIDSSGAPSSVFYPAGRKPARGRRSPARRFPTGRKRDRFIEIWMADLYEEVTLDEDILDSVQSLMV